MLNIKLKLIYLFHTLNSILYTKYVCISILGLILLSCRNDDELKFERRDYLGDELKIDGYFVHNANKSNGPLSRIFFLYRNGIVIDAGFSQESIENFENNIRMNEFETGIKDYKSAWGVFIINSEEIEIETWSPVSGGYKNLINCGDIINNERFVIHELYEDYKSNIIERQDTFHFVSFSPKPDSSNTFIQ